MMLREVEKVLQEHEYAYSSYSGCFDIVAKRESVLLLKLLGNIDSFQEEQARNLKILSHTLFATTLLIGATTRRETLEDHVVYERFSIPAMTVRTFESVVEGDMPALSRSRGGLFVEIDPSALREKRVAAGLTQEELARTVGVTKKNVYEHEKKQMKAEYRTVQELEKVIGTVTKPVTLEPSAEEVRGVPRTRFELRVSQDLRALGFETNSVYQAPFNILAEEGGFIIISEAEEKKQLIERKLGYIKNFSSVVKKPVLVVTKEEVSLDVPSIEESELKGISSSRRLKRLVKGW